MAAAFGSDVVLWPNADSWALGTLLVEAISDIPLRGGKLFVTADGHPALADFDLPEEVFASMLTPGSEYEMQVGKDIVAIIKWRSSRSCGR